MSSWFFFINLEYVAAFFFFFTSNGIISGLWFSPTPYQKDVSREVFFFVVFVFNNFNVEMFKKTEEYKLS